MAGNLLLFFENYAYAYLKIVKNIRNSNYTPQGEVTKTLSKKIFSRGFTLLFFWHTFFHLKCFAAFK